MKTMYSGVLTGRRKTSNKKLQNLYTAVYSIIIFIQSRMIRGAAHAGLIQWQLHIKFLFENHNRRQLERLGYRWEDSIKMDLKIIRREGVDYIHLSQQRGQWWPCVQAIITIHVLLQDENLTNWALYKPLHKHYSMEGGRDGLRWKKPWKTQDKDCASGQETTAKLFLHRVQQKYRNQQFNHFEHVTYCWLCAPVQKHASILPIKPLITWETTRFTELTKIELP